MAFFVGRGCNGRNMARGIMAVVMLLGVVTMSAALAPQQQAEPTPTRPWWIPTITATPDWQAIALYNRERANSCWATVRWYEGRWAIYMPGAYR